jgi:hypothetical protein
MIKIKYNASVFTRAGWRPETITAAAELISEKRARVVEVLDIGGNGSAGYASRTGAKRQEYSVSHCAKGQIGAIKNLSTCEVMQ